MIYVYFIVGAITHIIAATIAYQVHLKDKWFFSPTIIIAGLISGFMWSLVAKYTKDSNSLYFYGMVWDAVLVLVYAFMPLLFGVKLHTTGIVGLILVLVGLMLLKI